MGIDATCALHAHNGQHLPSDLTDHEWELLKPILPAGFECWPSTQMVHTGYRRRTIP